MRLFFGGTYLTCAGPSLVFREIRIKSSNESCIVLDYYKLLVFVENIVQFRHNLIFVK
jgi:hypothetical protein